MQKITPFLWFDKQAEEAVNYYVSIFKKSKINFVTHYGKEGFEIHKMREGTVMTIGFELDGQSFTAINGGPMFKFNESISFVVNCKDQKEIDYFWNHLSKDGDPKAQQCGWLKDKFGLSWQIIPEMLGRLVSNPAGMNAMLKMKKIDIKKLLDAENSVKKIITVKTTIKADIKKVWKAWTNPEHIKKWYFASDDWYVPYATNDLQVGKKFNIGMSSKDKKNSFDFVGTYTKIVPMKIIQYEIGDGRKVRIDFAIKNNLVEVKEAFEMESTNSEDKQRTGWQAILNNFKKLVEG